MALAFQDCCNTNNYFQVENIPGPIFEGSFYYVLTTNGLQFCGKYIELPTDIGYNPPLYNVQTLTKYTSCDTCQSDKNISCTETVNVIFASLPGGSNVTISECECETVTAMASFCNTSIIVQGQTSAPLSIGILGGTPPYKIYNNTTGVLLTTQNNPNSNITINPQAPEGTYSLRVEDFYSDYIEYLDCVINIPPALLSAQCIPTPPNIFGANNGQIQININGGTPPYLVTFENNTSTVNGPIKTYSNLSADTYTYSITDSGVGSEQQEFGTVTCTVNPGQLINYPTVLCVTISVCSTNYQLSFNWDGTTKQNYRPVYVCSNPNLIGAQEIEIYFDTTQGWITNAYSIGQFQTPQGCSSITNQFKIKQQTVNTSVSSQPTGNWTIPSPQYSFYNSSSIIVNGSQCVNAPIVVAPITNSIICNNGSSTQVSKTISVTSGNGPFTYYLNGAQQASPTFNAGVGTYSYYVTGLGGIQSQAQTFTVTSQNPTPLTFSNLCNYQVINNTITNSTQIAFASKGHITTSWPAQTLSTTTGTLINTTVNLKIVATVTVKVELDSGFNINNYSFVSSMVDGTSSTYNTNGVSYTVDTWTKVESNWVNVIGGTANCPIKQKTITLTSEIITLNGLDSWVDPLIYISDFILPIVESSLSTSCGKPGVSIVTDVNLSQISSPNNCVTLPNNIECYDVTQTYELGSYPTIEYIYYLPGPVTSTCGIYNGTNSYPSTPSTTGGSNEVYFNHALNASILLPNTTLDNLQTEGLLMYVKVTTNKALDPNTVNYYAIAGGLNLKLRVSLRYEVNRPSNVSLNVTDLVPVNTWDWSNYIPAVNFGPIPDDFPSTSPQLTALGFNQTSPTQTQYFNQDGTVPCGNGGNFNYSRYGTVVWESDFFNLGPDDLGTLNLTNLNSIYAFNILDTSIATPNGCPLELNWYVRADLIPQGSSNEGQYFYLGESDCYQLQIKFNDGSLTQQVTQGVVTPINNCVIPPP
jgi:hypothetical protein